MIHVARYRIVVSDWEHYENAARAQRECAYHAILNVCESPPDFTIAGPRLYWYPINEHGEWGYSPFFWSKRILDFHVGRSDSILIHCNSGVHRSPMILFAWLLSSQVAAGAIDFPAIDAQMGGEFSDLYQYDVRKRCIPADLNRLYELMGEWPQRSLTEYLERMQRHRAH